ncbi:MAG: hypothetical protein EBU90_17095 [Proteobacteria bacterium]|nr:hypothetical protein [Pseudomonadota bacterium]
MKVNQLLLSFMFLFGLAHNTLQAGQAVKAIKATAKAFAVTARIATNRASEQEEQIFMAVNAGKKILEIIDGLLKNTPTQIEENQSPTFMQTLSIAITGHATVGDALRTTGQQNLNKLVTWFKTNQVTALIKKLNPEIDGSLPLEEKKELLTQDQKNQVQKFESTFEKATGPVVRWLKGTSKPYEKIAIWLVLKTVSLINRFRNTFTSGKKLDDTSTIITEATTFITEQGVNRVFVMAEQGLTYIAERAQVAGEVIQGGLAQTGEVIQDGLAQAGETVGIVFQVGRDVANASVGMLTYGLSAIINWANVTVSTFFNFNAPENHFVDTKEISSTLLALLTNPEELEASLKDLLPEEYVQTLQDIAFGIQTTLQQKEVTQNTMDLLFNNIDKIIEETTLREIDVTDFSKLPDPLKAKILDAWKNAKSQDLIEVLVNLQQSGIDKTLLEVIGKNPEWEKLKTEELIQIPETLYDFLSLPVLIKVKKALEGTSPDFDTINKLTALSLTQEKAFKKATSEELLNLPAELYKEIPKEVLKKLEELLLSKNLQLTPEEMLNDPYDAKLKVIESLALASKPTTDSQSIQQQANAAKTKQEAAIAQNTTDAPKSSTQTTTDKTVPAADPQLPDFDNTPSRPRSDSTSSTGSIYEDALDIEKTPEEILAEEIAAQQAAKQKAAIEKAAAHDKLIESTQIEHTPATHGL